MGSRSESGLTVTWKGIGEGEVPTVEIVLPPSGPAKLIDQIEETLRAPLLKKALGQSAPAHAAGLKSAVIIDRTGHSRIAQGVHWLPQRPETIRQAVENVLPERHHLDAVLMLDLEGRWHILAGSFPGSGTA
jgi:hypothetical protein